jgi:hypothetical protein
VFLPDCARDPPKVSTNQRQTSAQGVTTAGCGGLQLQTNRHVTACARSARSRGAHGASLGCCLRGRSGAIVFGQRETPAPAVTTARSLDDRHVVDGASERARSWPSADCQPLPGGGRRCRGRRLGSCLRPSSCREASGAADPRRRASPCPPGAAPGVRLVRCPCPDHAPPSSRRSAPRCSPAAVASPPIGTPCAYPVVTSTGSLHGSASAGPRP